METQNIRLASPIGQFRVGGTCQIGILQGQGSVSSVQSVVISRFDVSGGKAKIAFYPYIKEPRFTWEGEVNLGTRCGSVSRDSGLEEPNQSP